MSQYRSAIDLPLLPAEWPSQGCLFSCRSKRGNKRDPPKRWLAAEGRALVSLSDQQIPWACIDKPWVLLTEPQPCHQSCGTRCLPLPRLHGRIAVLLCHIENTMAGSWTIKWGNSWHTFPFSWTVGNEEGRKKMKRKKEKAHFGIQPDISFVFLLIA